MSETPPPHDRPEPAEDETIVAPAWPARPEGEVMVEQTRTEAVPRRRAPVIWPWLLALLLLVLGGLGAYFIASRDDDDAAATTATTPSSPATQEAAPVSVPDVVGTTSSEATAALRDAGLAANLVSVPSSSPAGTVVAQSPAAGQEVTKGSTVRLNVAQRVEASPPPTTTGPVATTAPIEPAPAVVPEVVGRELADAARAFGDEGLKVSVAYVPSGEPRGRVVAQAQPAGTERERGDTVQVNVSNGPEPSPATEVPAVAGLEQAAARRKLESAGFEVLAIEFAGNRPGIVISHSPPGGAAVPRGSLVILYVGT